LLPGPLHRFTRLKADPAWAWLSPGDRALVALTGAAAWVGYGVFLFAVRRALGYVLSTLSGSYDLGMSVGIGGRSLTLQGLATAGLAAVCFVPMRRYVISLRARTTAEKARKAATALATAIDDLRALGDEEDGRIVSLVGWVRGHGYLYHRVDGQQAVGLSIRVQDEFPFLMETMHNFDLVDEDGAAALVVTEGARLLGKTNHRLSRANNDDRQLLMSLDMPATAVPTDWNAFIVRDGDPVMVVGRKTTIQDLTELQHGRASARTAVASTKEHPLLVIPLEAERLEV
jgi:hypothetical protein